MPGGCRGSPQSPTRPRASTKWVDEKNWAKKSISKNFRYDDLFLNSSQSIGWSGYKKNTKTFYPLKTLFSLKLEWGYRQKKISTKKIKIKKVRLTSCFEEKKLFFSTFWHILMKKVDFAPIYNRKSYCYITGEPLFQKFQTFCKSNFLNFYFFSRVFFWWYPHHL